MRFSKADKLPYHAKFDFGLKDLGNKEEVDIT
jgi:hypothetical protein